MSALETAKALVAAHGNASVDTVRSAVDMWLIETGLIWGTFLPFCAYGTNVNGLEITK